MALKIVEIHPAETSEALNTEWFLLENDGEKPFSTNSCTLSVSRRGSKKRAALGNLNPGFTIAPGERIRVVTGNPGRKAHGAPPADDTRNYHLFLGAPVLKSPGVVLVFSLRSLIIAQAEYDPNGQAGVYAAPGKP